MGLHIGSNVPEWTFSPSSIPSDSLGTPQFLQTTNPPGSRLRQNPRQNRSLLFKAGAKSQAQLCKPAPVGKIHDLLEPCFLTIPVRFRQRGVNGKLPVRLVLVELPDLVKPGLRAGAVFRRVVQLSRFAAVFSAGGACIHRPTSSRYD
jgi:hypothetical protein